jgi:hypothetical protein
MDTRLILSCHFLERAARPLLGHQQAEGGQSPAASKPVLERHKWIDRQPRAPFDRQWRDGQQACPPLALP